MCEDPETRDEKLPPVKFPNTEPPQLLPRAGLYGYEQDQAGKASQSDK